MAWKCKLRTEGSIKFNLRFKLGPTSVTLRKETVALWMLFAGTEDKNDFVQWIYDECLPKWGFNHCTGLGNFISHRIYFYVLDNSDYYRWRNLCKGL